MRSQKKRETKNKGNKQKTNTNMLEVTYDKRVNFTKQTI